MFSAEMYDKLENQWASAVLAFLALVMAPFPLIFFKYGERLRARSRYAAVKKVESPSAAAVAADAEKQV